MFVKSVGIFGKPPTILSTCAQTCQRMQKVCGQSTWNLPSLYGGDKGWKLGRETTREDLATNWADMLCQNVRGQDEKTAQTLQGALNIEKQLLAVRAKHSHLQDILDSTVCHFIVDCRG